MLPVFCLYADNSAPLLKPVSLSIRTHSSRHCYLFFFFHSQSALWGPLRFWLFTSCWRRKSDPGPGGGQPGHWVEADDSLNPLREPPRSTLMPVLPPCFRPEVAPPPAPPNHPQVWHGGRSLFDVWYGCKGCQTRIVLMSDSEEVFRGSRVLKKVFLVSLPNF